VIYIVDYGLGNIKAFSNVFKRLNIEVNLAKSALDLKSASKIILPGVGSFDHAMTLLKDSGMFDELNNQVLNEKKPVIGICVGMQILANGSDEGDLPGLGWIPGMVRKFDASKLSHKTSLPHMGWNTIEVNQNIPLFDSIDDRSRFYFLHSFYFEPEDDINTAAYTDYGIKYSSCVLKDNIYGVQFHPEKSHSNGELLLKNFANL
jgi:imidazole glycerol-phosphate synthase subunit HisH